MSFLKNLIIACSLLSSVESRPVSPIIPVAVAAAHFLAGAALCTLGYKNLTVYDTPAQETGKPASFRPMTLEEALGAYFGGFIIGIIPGVNIAGFLHILNIDGLESVVLILCKRRESVWAY